MQSEWRALQFLKIIYGHHPSTTLPAPMSLEAHRVREVLNFLAKGLPDSFGVFHDLNWSSLHGDRQQFVNIDLAVVSFEPCLNQESNPTYSTRRPNFSPLSVGKPVDSLA
jgi:hypothetical protein